MQEAERKAQDNTMTNRSEREESLVIRLHDRLLTCILLFSDHYGILLLAAEQPQSQPTPCLQVRFSLFRPPSTAPPIFVQVSRSSVAYASQNRNEARDSVQLPNHFPVLVIPCATPNCCRRVELHRQPRFASKEMHQRVELNFSNRAFVLGAYIHQAAGSAIPQKLAVQSIVLVVVVAMVVVVGTDFIVTVDVVHAAVEQKIECVLLHHEAAKF